MKKPTKAKVREAFRTNYRSTGDISKSWHETIKQFASRARPGDKQVVANLVNDVYEDVLVEEGDTVALVANAAAETIGATNVLEALENEYESVSQGLSQEELEQLQYPVLFVQFDENGAVSEMSIDHAGNFMANGPAVAVLPGRALEEVRRDIATGLRELMANPEPEPLDFARRHDVRLKAKRIPNRQDGQEWPAGSSHWDCVLRRGKSSMRMTFSAGPAIESNPDVAEVLYTAASDAIVYETIRNPDDLATELGLDRREAHQLYGAVEQQTADLQLLLGSESLYADLLCEVDANPNINPVSPRMRAALFAGAGSILGTLVGAAIGGGVGSWMGAIAGGAAGGYLGSSEATKVGGTVGGALGGTLYPIGAAAGAYIGTYEKNPEPVTVQARNPDDAARKANRFGRVLDVQPLTDTSYRVLVQRLTVGDR